MIRKRLNTSTDYGLSNKEALIKLKTAIQNELEKDEKLSQTNRIPLWLQDAFHHKSSYSSFNWSSAAILCLCIFFLSIYQVYEDQNFRLKSVAFQIFFLTIFLLGNVFLISWDSFLRYGEMRSKINFLLKSLEGNCDLIPKGDQYFSLHTPQSPCVSVQWTCRDGQLLNLPCSLLVEGDVILMRPGHAAPGHCKSLNPIPNSCHNLKRGQIFATIDEGLTDNFNNPRLRKPAQSMKFVMLETPFINRLKSALQNSLSRPVTLFNKEYQAIVYLYLERILLPLVLISVLCIGSIRSLYFESEHDEWAEHLLLRPVLSVLPLLPISLPFCWIMLNAFGNSYLLAIVNSKQCLKPSDPFDEIEEVTPSVIENCVTCRDLKDFLCFLLFGKKGYLWRSANLLQVLGSITALCCVDKKGILSWPNPTAEKVFFLKSPKSKSNSEDSTQLCSDAGQDTEESQALNEEVLEIKRFAKTNKRLDVKDHIYHPGSQVEVLDLTHNLHSPFGLQFDDPNWKFFIGNLKPLGLGILLNTCNPKVQEHYTKFSDHIACESLYNDAAVPVVNKRCLCVLAKQIGFSDSVVDFYNLEQQLGIFRHVHPEVIQKGKLAKSLNFPRLKMPFPSMSCVVVKDLHRGSNQLFSQGTADLVLDACNEYWDGNDIRALTDSDRKRILDFYHRSSLTAHCMGYAYSPLSNISLDKNFSNWYFELPAEGYHLFSALETASSSPRSWDPPCNDGSCTQQHSISRYLSSDSLIMGDQEREWNSGVNNCLQQLGNEIFIGMVTMQYQACPDFVRLIEQLDKACIRFVHFSKENELRSRVFSEKMGLESGWNCHISLLSDEKCFKHDTIVSPLKYSRHATFTGTVEDIVASDNCNEAPVRHASAPSVINLDVNVVKSEELSTHSKSEDSVSLYHTTSAKTYVGTESLFQDTFDKPKRKSLSSFQDIFMVDDSNLSHSPSHVTESTDQSAPVTFDMSNRAKLPKGTENIRPHIENVDNVPLQVSLFTDCTPEATREMICIMQEYGEVVCCLGSSANTENMSIFLQADASIAIQPLLPQLCVQKSLNNGVYAQNEMENISSSLNSLPCGVSIHREDPISLYHLIMEARHFMCSTRNSLEFMLCCCLSIALVQVLSVLFFLPLVLPLSHMLWLIILEIPLLSLSLMGHPVNSKVMMLATGKNLKVVNKQAILLFIACYCAKFCPSVVIAIFSFTCIMSSACKVYLESDSSICWVTLDLTKPEKKINSESWFAVLTVSQNVLSFFLVICFIIISISFIHRTHLLWKSNPFVNKYWILTTILVIVLHLVFNIIDISIHVDTRFHPVSILDHIPYYVWIICSLWPFFVIPLNEFVKRHEIKINVRQQKRARLEFCTKLGMNSPF